MSTINPATPLTPALPATNHPRHIFRWLWSGTLALIILLTAALYSEIDPLRQRGWTSLVSSDLFVPEIDLARDDQGTIWKVRPTLLVGGGGTFHPPADFDPAMRSLTTVAVDRHNRVWLGAGYGMILMMDTNQHWTTFTPKNSGLPDLYVNVLAVDPQDHLWVGTSQGLGVFDVSGHWTDMAAGQGSHQTVAFAFDSQNRVWAETTDGPMVLNAGGQWTLGPQPPTDSLFVAFAVDDQGRAWVGDMSLHVLEPDGNWTTYTGRNSGLAGGIWALGLDAQGRLLIHTVNGWQTFDQSAALAPALIDQLTQLRTLGLWLAVAMLAATGLWTARRVRGGLRL
jgi:ligand-binding sensor domain-containing protein